MRLLFSGLVALALLCSDLSTAVANNILQSLYVYNFKVNNYFNFNFNFNYNPCIYITWMASSHCCEDCVRVFLRPQFGVALLSPAATTSNIYTFAYQLVSIKRSFVSFSIFTLSAVEQLTTSFISSLLFERTCFCFLNRSFVNRCFF